MKPLITLAALAIGLLASGAAYAGEQTVKPPSPACIAPPVLSPCRNR